MRSKGFQACRAGETLPIVDEGFMLLHLPPLLEEGVNEEIEGITDENRLVEPPPRLIAEHILRLNILEGLIRNKKKFLLILNYCFFLCLIHFC